MIIASLSRWAPALAYAVTVGAVLGAVLCRQEPAEPLAATALSRNREIQESDLTVKAFDGLVGKYLKEDVAAGKPITAQMVSDKPLGPAAANTFAARVSISLEAKEKLALKTGSDVQICTAVTAFGGMAKVLSLDCDAAYCAVLVGLTAMPTPASPGDPLADAWLTTTAPDGCAGPRP
ncbi:hypothetical protein M8R20_10965 [Pseudomonas sp. R2.Fl]|nr:hypothetical protein [Pseudomonas sp. R2.Fl]